MVSVELNPRRINTMANLRQPVLRQMCDRPTSYNARWSYAPRVRCTDRERPKRSPTVSRRLCPLTPAVHHRCDGYAMHQHRRGDDGQRETDDLFPELTR